MSKNRSVYQRADGNWVNKKNGGDKASSLHKTQKDAENAAREMLKNQGGGELTTHRGDNGRIRSKDTIAKKDPNPPKDTEH